MPDTSQQPSMKAAARPSAAAPDTGMRRPHADDDLALGFECADPWLQIERWSEEVQTFPFGRP